MINKIMNIFTKVFFETTNPLTDYKRLLKSDVLFSIIFHNISYISIIYIISKIFNLNLTNEMYKKIIICLFVVMILGYYLRLNRVKTLYKILIKNNNKKIALEKSKSILNNGYFTFYFLA